MGRSPGLVVVVGASYFVGHGFESLNRSQERLFRINLLEILLERDRK